MSEDLPVFLSRNRLEGSLADTPLKSLMEPCRRHLVTGTIRIDSREGRGVLQMRAGVVDHASFGLLVGDAAVIRMSLLRDGSYQLEQRAPDLSGELGPAASLESDVSHVPLAQVMRHCEDNALSCSVIVVSSYDRAEIRYHAGELTEVTLNGVPDPDAIVRITRWTDAKYKLQLDPLAPEIEGWPKASREPTAPFKLERMPPPPAKLAHGSGPVTTVAPPPGATPTPMPAMVSEKLTMPPPRTRAQTVRPQAVPPPPSAAILGVGEATEVTGPPAILKNLPPAKKPAALIVADEPTPAPRKRAASVHPAILDADGPLFGMRDNDSAPSEVTAPRRGKGPPPPPGKPSVLFTPAQPMAASAAPAPPREKLAPPPPPPGRRTPAQPLAAVDAVDDRPPSRPMPPPVPAQAKAKSARGTGSQDVARPAAPMPQAQRMNTSGSWVVPHMTIHAVEPVSGKTAAPLMAKPFVREARRSSRGTWTFVAVLVLVFGGGGLALWYYAQPQTKRGSTPVSTPASEASPAKASQPSTPAPAASTPAATPANKSAQADADVDPQPSSSATPAAGSVAAQALAAASGAPASTSSARPAEKPRTTRQLGFRGKRARRR
jgi:hypothetical protein